MHMKSLTLKGFKSFSDRTRLDFGPGVSVIVGPNGSGKSNVSDAVMWAMGEQSPLAVRGQSMQDVIFGGAQGVQARSFAEVEIVLDNSDGAVELPLGEISIVRRLERSGEGEYRLCGARCRLADVMEMLSDTGLGKEAHSVISQGRVEAIVTSKPRERRLLIEEAAGLGKHRRRRRRAQLKLERTQENLDRALDVEREARAHLRPLKRQSEAAELHERLERQMLELRLGLSSRELHTRRLQLVEAEAAARAAREVQAQVEAQLQGVVERRSLAERALSERAERHDQLARLAFGARSSHERLQLRAEQVQATTAALSRRILATEAELEELGTREQNELLDTKTHDHVQALEAELAEIERERGLDLERETASLQLERSKILETIAELEGQITGAREALESADEQAGQARQALRVSELAEQEARREAAGVGAELAAVNQFLRSHAHPLSGASSGTSKDHVASLAETLRVQEGYELALAAALGGRLEAALVADMPDATRLLDAAGIDGGTVLLAASGGAEALSGDLTGAPSAGARRLLELVSGPTGTIELATRLLDGVWVVDRLQDLPADFGEVAVTRSGRVWFGGTGEVRQVTEGGAERVLASRNERERLVGRSEQAAQGEQAAKREVQEAHERLLEAQARCESAQTALRALQRRGDEAAEEERRVGWLMEQRHQRPEQGPSAVRRAQLEGELAAELRQGERLEAERQERAARRDALRSRHDLDLALVPEGERLLAVLGSSGEAAAECARELEARLSSDREAGEEMAASLRACAGEEAEIQAKLRGGGEAVTAAEVAAQRLRDQAQEAQLELEAILERLALSLEEVQDDAETLSDEQVQEYSARLQRLQRRREQLGPINPLAMEEYAQAVEHVEELEARRGDLESALRELRSVIRDTDRQIHETFEATFAAAARNFEELVGDVFPGGKGRLRLISDQVAPRAVLGGAAPTTDAQGASEEGDLSEKLADAEAAADAEAGAAGTAGEDDLLGVEIEIAPAGKATKRLSLLSGGEKSMTALAFLFAVFLARPCPFYILDEVEAALDDLNLDRFLLLLRRYSGRAQFIVITHQKRTMEAADWLYGVSMGGDGVSKVISRRLPPELQQDDALGAGAGGEAEVSAAA